MVGIIVTGLFLLLSIIVLIPCIRDYKKGNIGIGCPFFGVLSTVLVLICHIMCVEIYNSPHHGREPYIDDVTEHTAHIDTFQIIKNNDTTYQYKIEWNE